MLLGREILGYIPVDYKATDKYVSFYRTIDHIYPIVLLRVALFYVALKSSGRIVPSNVFSIHTECHANLWHVFLSFLLASSKTDLLFLYGFR